MKRKTAQKIRVYGKRPKDLGMLIVVGGPGGSGSTTIARMLASHFGLQYIYGGAIMRRLARKNGFDTLEEFLTSKEFKKDSKKYDKLIDEETMKASQRRNVLVESKNFAALATLKQQATTVKIWVDANISTRVRRTLHSKKGIEHPENVAKTSFAYRTTATELMQRYSNDKNRYAKLYGIDFDTPELYNDIVVDASHLTAGETFNLILKEIKRGKYIRSSSK